MIIGDSELRREVTLKAMEGVTDLINGQCLGAMVESDKLGAVMTVLTAAVREAMGPEAPDHGLAGNDV